VPIDKPVGEGQFRYRGAKRVHALFLDRTGRIVRGGYYVVGETPVLHTPVWWKRQGSVSSDSGVPGVRLNSISKGWGSMARAAEKHMRARSR
jgi:hypothetical protein